MRWISEPPRHGRPLEELGTYDPHVKDTDARALLKAERVDYWLSVGALPSEKVAVLIKKYGTNGTHVDAQKAALERLGAPKVGARSGRAGQLAEVEGRKGGRSGCSSGCLPKQRPKPKRCGSNRAEAPAAATAASAAAAAE